MNQESLYFCRLAGDRSMELLTLHLARSVLESHDRLTPRVRTLFLVREARALAQGGDERILGLFDLARSCYEDGVRESDPK
ncbi:MAG: hypothetical protein ABIZ05_15040 [Pseudonocardiaceae bacterium]